MNNENKVQVKERLLSLDALRGFDMFWIVGGVYLIRAMAKGSTYGWLQTIEEQTHHAQWAGFHFYDLIFPLFMFISGVAIPYSILSKLEGGVPRINIVRKTARRMIMLVVIGFIYNGNLREGVTEPLFESVLGQIGISYFLASLIILYTSSIKSQLYWLFGILAGYAAIQLLVPVPGIGAGVLTPEGCINGYIDRMFMPGKLYGGSFTPEGYLCILSATGITMMGYMAGHLLKKKDETSAKKIKMLSMIGIGLIILALILHPFYPVIKNCWTTTFNLLAGGISFLLLAIFYFIIDVKKWRNWAFFFIVIGMNSIFIYLFKSLVNIEFTSKYLLGWLAGLLGETGGSLVIISGGLALSWLLLYFMYLKKIFIKV